MGKEVLSFEDLTVIAQLGDTVLLLIKTEDIDKEGADCVQIHLGSGEFNKNNISLFIKFNPFEETNYKNEAEQKYYKDLIFRKLDNQKLFEILLLLNEE